MDSSKIMEKILKTLKDLRIQDDPDISLIKDCIDLIYDNGLEIEMADSLERLNMLYTMQSFLEGSEHIKNDLIGETAKGERALTFKIRETEEKTLVTSLDMSGFQTLELLGCIALMEKAVHKVIKDNK